MALDFPSSPARLPARLAPDDLCAQERSRLEAVYAYALRVWRHPEAAEDFLLRPQILLDGRTPRDAAMDSDNGASWVRALLMRLESGLAT